MNSLSNISICYSKVVISDIHCKYLEMFDVTVIIVQSCFIRAVLIKQTLLCSLGIVILCSWMKIWLIFVQPFPYIAVTLTTCVPLCPILPPLSPSCAITLLHFGDRYDRGYSTSENCWGRKVVKIHVPFISDKCSLE